jgi:DNA-binding protein YbaB
LRNTGNPELDREIARVGEQLQMLQDLPARLAAIKGAGEAATGFIKVTVDSTGRLDSLEINPRAMRSDSQTLGEEIMRAVQAAYDDMQVQMREIISPSEGTNDALKRIMASEGVKEIPSDVLDGPGEIARAANPMIELSKQLKRMQDLL